MLPVVVPVVVCVVAVTGVVSALLADARTSAKRSQAFMNFAGFSAYEGMERGSKGRGRVALANREGVS